MEVDEEVSERVAVSPLPERRFEFSKEFKPDKLTLGGNTRYSHSDNDARSKSDRQNILPGDSSSYDNSEAMSRTKSDNFGVDFRLEWNRTR